MEKVILGIIFVLILIVLYFVYSENFAQTVEGDRLGRTLKGYVGHPLDDTVYTSGADLRLLGTQFSSTDQGSERFRNLAKNYK